MTNVRDKKEKDTEFNRWGWIPAAMLITAIVVGVIALLVWLVAIAWSVWRIWQAMG